jgi:hypothetical protein
VHGPYDTVICGLSGSTIFFHIILMKGTTFRGKKKLLNMKLCLDFIYNLSLKYLSFKERFSEIPSMNAHSSPYNVLGIPVMFQRSLNFLDTVAKILQT